MTMIRINLIAERKAGGAPKVAKKAPASGQMAELQENLVLLILVFVALAVVAFMWNQVTNELKEVTATKAKLDKEYKSLQKYEKEKEDYDIQKELLSEKILKITELRDLREGPVKVLEDVANSLPESAWLVEILQGFDAGLVKATRSEGRAIKPEASKIKDPNLFMVVGRAKTSDAATNFTDRILRLDSRYSDTELNTFSQITEKEGGQDVRVFEFSVFFKVLRGVKAAPEGGN